MTDLNSSTETQVHKAKVDNKFHSIVWLLPLTVFLILSWIAYETYTQKGTNITIVFKSGEGIKSGVTPLEYKGLQLGKVTDVEINQDLKTVNVNVLLKNDVAQYIATDTSRFWIKKPTVSLTKVSGLSTLINGYRIELAPILDNHKVGEQGNRKTHFIGLESQPENELEQGGYYVPLIASGESRIEVGTPIFYNKYQIGEVISKTLSQGEVHLNSHIYNKYAELVNQSSKFIMNDAIKVNYGPSGLSVKVGSFYSALVGGITVVTPNKIAPRIDPKNAYVIHDNENDSLKKVPIEIRLLNAVGIGADTPIIYKGIEVGELEQIKLEGEGVLANGFVYEAYQYLLTDNTEFFVEKTELSLSGVKNADAIIKGNYISLIPKEGAFSNQFQTADYKQQLESHSSLKLTLFAKSLKSISEQSKLYFKNIEIGQVIKTDLTDDLQAVEITLKVNNQYQSLINDSSLFYDISSKLVEVNKLNLNINYEGIKPLLNGGIGLVNISKAKSKDENNHEANKLTQTKFQLYDSYEAVKAIERMSNKGIVINASFENSVDIQKEAPVKYQNQEIGFVKSVHFNESRSNAELFIYSEYAQYISEKSQFYQSSPLSLEASMAGIHFTMEDFFSLLGPSIYLNNESTVSRDIYPIFASKDDMKNQTNLLSVLFKEVEGLKEDFSHLVYKGVNVGKVVNIELTDNDQVRVDIQIYDDYQSFAQTGTSYYLKKPHFSLQAVKNPGSAIMPVEIGVIKTSQEEPVFSHHFIGYQNVSEIESLPFGQVFKVTSSQAPKASLHSPIYYKKVEIGKITKLDLNTDSSKVVIDCLIYNKYTKLVRKNSSFYDISGMDMSVSLFSGTQINTNTLASILIGGILLVTPEEYGEPANSTDTFEIQQGMAPKWIRMNPSIE